MRHPLSWLPAAHLSRVVFLAYVAALVLGLLILAGCVAAVNRAPEDRVTIACQGYAGTLTSLSVARARGQLTPEQIATVDGVRPSLNAICIDGDYTDPTTARQAVEEAMWRLIRIEESTQ